MFSNKSFFAIAAGLALTACTMEPLIDNGGENPEDKGDRIITVSFASETRTALGSDGITPEFVGNETIRVSNGTEYQDCTVEITGNGAVFATKLNGELRAVYPAESGKIDGNVITGIVFPAEQDGSFASANIAEATIPEKATSATFKNQASLFVITPPDGTSYLMVKSLRPVENGVARTGEASAINSEGEAGMIVTNTGFDPKDGKVYLALLPGADIRDIQIDAVSETQGKGSIISFPPSMTDTIAVNSAYTVANNWHEYVTIDGRKWATANVGASSPTEAGRYFAWGDVVGQTWNGSAWSGGGFSSAPEIGNPETLPLQYDAAYANWGGDWRMPTREEFGALEEGEYGTVSSVYGRTYGTSDVQMFLPVTGIGDGTTIDVGEDNDWGWYWSSSLYDSGRSYGLFFTSTASEPDWESCNYGFPVRAIIDAPALDITVEDLKHKVEVIKERVQSISIIPAAPDGSILAKDDTLCISCVVTPAEAVENLEAEDFTVLLNTVQTRAVNIKTICEFDFSKDPEKGMVSIRADVSEYSPDEGQILTAAVSVKTDIKGATASSLTTKFVNVKTIFSPPQEPDPQEGELVEVVVWENDGTCGEINWNGVYRFSNTEHSSSEEIYAIPMEQWAVIKEGVFRVAVETTEGSNIRITTGWWTGGTYGGIDHNCIDMVNVDENGSKYIEVNIKEDGNLYDNIDAQHLLFTGSGYTVKKIYYFE